MNTVIINGSPRKNMSTGLLLQEAAKGAKAAGDQVEYVDLYDLSFSGCRSCLACKRKGAAEPCRCYWQDGATALLDRIFRADRLIIGSPIYFGEPTAQLRCLFERLVFPALSYNDYGSTFKGKLDTEVFLTMNVTREAYDRNYAAKMEAWFGPMSRLNGTVRLHPCCDTTQVADYSQYDMAGMDVARKAKARETQFPLDLQHAHDVGAGKL